MHRGPQLEPARFQHPADAQAEAVSCATAGHCTVAGLYHDQATNNPHAFVADESGGTWGQAHVIPGADTMGPPRSRRCPARRLATAGHRQLHRRRHQPAGIRRRRDRRHLGQAQDANGHAQAFIANQKTPS